MKKTLPFVFIFLFAFVFSSSHLSAQCEGGRITTTHGKTTAYACVNDGQNDFTSFQTNSLAMTSYTYLITDANNIILAITNNNFANFEDAGIGNCRIWGLSYEGDLLAAPGDDATAIDLANGCFELTENFITVIRREIVTTELSSLFDPTSTLIEITNNDIATVVAINQSGIIDNYVYVLQRSDDKIIEINDTGLFDMAGLPMGRYFIYGFNYTGTILLGTGDQAGDPLSDGCFTKSTSFLTIDKTAPSNKPGCQAEGGTVKTKKGQTVAYACVNNGDDDFVGFANSSISGSQYRYLITDANNIILGIANNGFANFEGAGIGNCRVWGLSFEGVLLAQPGDDAATAILADGCFDLSDNFIEVIREVVEVTQVSTTMEETSIEINDNAAANFSFMNSGNNGANYVYVIVRTDEKIVGITEESFDFAFQKPGKYFVYGYSYLGDLNVQVGMKLSGNIATGCFAKTTNLVFIRKKTDAAIPAFCVISAGTLDTNQPTVTLNGGVAFLSATPNGDAIIPTDADVVYVLTSGAELTVQMISPVPLFTVVETGNYRIHTLVAELNDLSSADFFDGSAIVPGLSTSADLVAAIEEQGVCADLDVMGIDIEVIENQACQATTGILIPDMAEVNQSFFTIISASLILEPVVPVGYEVTYFAALGDDKVVTYMGDASAFIVEETGVFNIFMLVAETSNPASPNYVDLSTISLGETTFSELEGLTNDPEICLALDGLGATITVVGAFAVERSQDDNTAKINTPQMALFPNPTVDYINIELDLSPNTSDKINYQLVDVQGRVIRQHQLNARSGSNQWTINVNDLPSGLYYLQLQNGEEYWTPSFMKK